MDTVNPDNLATVDIGPLADALRESYRNAPDTHRGAVYALIHYNSGHLLRQAGVREHMRVSGNGQMIIKWRELGAATTDIESLGRTLNSSAVSMIQFASALASDRVISLRVAVERMGPANGAIMATAFAIACGFNGELVVLRPGK